MVRVHLRRQSSLHFDLVRKSGMSRKHVATGHNQIDPLDFLLKLSNDGESQVTLAASIYHESKCKQEQTKSKHYYYGIN